MHHDDHELSRVLAHRAGELLLELRHTGDGPALGARGDAASQAFLSRELATSRPGDAILSEEAKDDRSRLERDRVWIIDPLDGTREYAEGRQDWAVHVALWEEGRLVAGAVSLPASGGVTLSTASTSGVAKGPTGGPLRIAVSRSRPPSAAQRFVEDMGAVLVPMGSAGFKAMAVVRGDVDAYVHAGGQYEWDSAAPVVVAQASGSWASRLDGTPLVYNQEDPYLPDLVIARPDAAKRILALYAGDGDPTGYAEALR